MNLVLNVNSTGPVLGVASTTDETDAGVGRPDRPRPPPLSHCISNELYDALRMMSAGGLPPPPPSLCLE